MPKVRQKLDNYSVRFGSFVVPRKDLIEKWCFEGNKLIQNKNIPKYKNGTNFCKNLFKLNWQMDVSCKHWIAGDSKISYYLKCKSCKIGYKLSIEYSELTKSIDKEESVEIAVFSQETRACVCR